MSGFLAFLMAGADDNAALAALLAEDAPLDDGSLEKLAELIAPPGSPKFAELIGNVLNCDGYDLGLWE